MVTVWERSCVSSLSRREANKVCSLPVGGGSLPPLAAVVPAAPLPLAPSAAKGCLCEAPQGSLRGWDGPSASCFPSPLLGRLGGIGQPLGIRPWCRVPNHTLARGSWWAKVARWRHLGWRGHLEVQVWPSRSPGRPSLGASPNLGGRCLNLPCVRSEPGTVPGLEGLCSILLREGGLWVGILTGEGWTWGL